MGHYSLGGLRERRMLALQVLVLVLAPLASSQPAPTSCCETKTVGGVSYTFVREDSAALGYSCLSPCVYERDDQPGTAFCFAHGDQQVVCGDSPGLEGGVTSGPGVTRPTTPESPRCKFPQPLLDRRFRWSSTSMAM